MENGYSDPHRISKNLTRVMCISRYGEYEITIEIKTGVITGKFPRRVLNAVLEWYILHKVELIENWEFAEKKIPLKKIEPLE